MPTDDLKDLRNNGSLIIDTMAADSILLRRPLSRQNQLLGPYVALLLLRCLFTFRGPGTGFPALRMSP